MSNYIHISGRLTKDAEIKLDGKLLTFPLADNDSYINKAGEKVQTVEYHDCEKPVSETSTLASHLKKGTAVNILGKLQTAKWEKDGESHERKVIHVMNIDFQ